MITTFSFVLLLSTTICAFIAPQLLATFIAAALSLSLLKQVISHTLRANPKNIIFHFGNDYTTFVVNPNFQASTGHVLGSRNTTIWQKIKHAFAQLLSYVRTYTMQAIKIQIDFKERFYCFIGSEYFNIQFASPHHNLYQFSASAILKLSIELNYAQFVTLLFIPFIIVAPLNLIFAALFIHNTHNILTASMPTIILANTLNDKNPTPFLRTFIALPKLLVIKHFAPRALSFLPAGPLLAAAFLATDLADYYCKPQPKP